MENKSQELFETIIRSGPILEVQLYQVNPSYYEIPYPLHWIIDGGVELNFAIGSICMGWSNELEMYMIASKSFNEIYLSSNFHLLVKDNYHPFSILTGKTIIESSWKWAPIQVFNSDIQDFEEDQALLELILNLDSGETIQIAPIEYQINSEGDPLNYQRMLDRELLVSLNHVFELD